MRFQRYESIEREGFSERNDCTVRAVSAACNASYASAHSLLAAAGRKPRRGMYFQQYMANQTELLGCKVTRVATGRPTLEQALYRYMADGRYIVVKRGHAFAVIDGVVIDTAAVGSRSRVLAIWRVDVPADEDESKRRELRLRIEALEALLKGRQ